MSTSPDELERLGRECMRQQFAKSNGDGYRDDGHGDGRSEYDDRPPDPPNQEPEREPAPSVEIFTAPDLLRMELPEARCVVSDIIPEGLTLLAGKPKLGKSWWALDVALAVAEGGVALGRIDVQPGDVLYLALEDTRRRLRSRLEKILSATDAKAPSRLTLTTGWPRQDKGGLYALAEWLDTHREARLVVIDTWQKFRPQKTRNRDSYEEDYEHASQVKALADKYHVAVVPLHHCRKMDADDPVDSVSGTLGLTGCADAVLVLKRERGQHDAVLFVTGRDLEEQELALKWDPEYAHWSVLGGADEYRLSRERAAVIELLRKEARPMSPSEAAPLLNKTTNAVKLLLWKLSKEGWVKSVEGGKYQVC
jgi:hypothetical protein